MELGLVFGLLKVAIETFNDERQDRFLKKYVMLEKEWQDEMALPDDQRSDLTLDRILFECHALAKLVIAEKSK
jgi:acetyl-CoA carboxylase carboxyltransferase component